MNWRDQRVLVTGGASFIGAALVDELVSLGATVRVVDDLSSGSLENLARHIEGDEIEFKRADLRDARDAKAAVKDVAVVFHLAGDHGGRGYVDLHQAACAGNFALDGTVFRACRDAEVEKVVFASSGCVYPNFAQTDSEAVVYLSEDQVHPPYDADNMYGYAKLMGELTLKAYCDEWGMKAAACRYFTVYGERAREDHAVIAMIARAFIGQDPFPLWGTGEQVRNWTYIGDIVRGSILAAERIDDGMAINLGTMERTRVIDAAREVLSYTGRDLRIELHPEMPTGPINRVADNRLARELLGWQPQVCFVDGLHRTIDWYFENNDPAEVRRRLEDGALTERTIGIPAG